LVWVIIFGTVYAGYPLPRSVFGASKPSRLKIAAATRDASRAALNNYVGSAACARCHADIYRSFSRTRMGRSLTVASANVIQSLPIPAAFDSESLDRHFEVFSSEGKLYQSESQATTNGSDIFRDTRAMQWIIGAGANGYGALLQRSNYLFEAPLSYYTKTHKWELSPGYEGNDIGFSRTIQAGCISCHSGRAYPTDQNTGRYTPTPFSETSIGCENCHGPGARHLLAVSRGGSLVHGPQIVNPGRLSSELENDICMSCHEAGDARVLKPGKTYQDFRPGTPLDDTFSILMVPLKRDDADDRDHVQHYFEMSMSKCFRATAGQLRCASCHDPHVEPSQSEAPVFFNAKCAGCHTSRACTLPLPARQQTKPADNCIGCHMPQREETETAHTSLTNHRILIRQGEPWPEEAFQQTSASLPDLVHLNRASSETDEVPALTALEAYREIAERKPEYAAAYQRILSDLERTDPDHAEVQQGLGKRELDGGNLQQAVFQLRRAIQLDPDQGPPQAYLSEALAQLNQLDDAIDASEKAVSIDPFNPLFRKALIDRLIAAKRYDKAIAAMDLYMELFPEDNFMRKMLKIAQE
jgi:Flp pilus assembly protein TadD